jgi:hypothetical protein
MENKKLSSKKKRFKKNSIIMACYESAAATWSKVAAVESCIGFQFIFYIASYDISLEMFWASKIPYISHRKTYFFICISKFELKIMSAFLQCEMMLK